MNTQDSRLTLPIDISSVREVEPFVRHWCEKSNVKDEVQFRLVYAVNEMTEGIVRLGTALSETGTIELEAVPYSGNIEIRLSFPQDIPLDPSFKHNDGLLEQFPGMTISPDIFWHHIILNWIDKASWLKKGKKITIILTQFARDPNKAGELYFLSIKPKLPESLQITYGKNNYVIARYQDQESAIRLTEKAAFILRAVDGQTPVREIYYDFVQKFGLIHPLNFGRMVEDLIEKKLILTGDPIISKSPGRWEKISRRLLKLRYSFPEPDKVITAINRKAGWIWSKKALAFYIPFLFLTSFFFILNHRKFSSGFDSVLNRELHLPLWFFLVFYGSYAISIILHELSHGIVCKRFGGIIHELGIMVYFGNICPYVDTTDTWMFAEKRHRIAVSFAGPLATLLWAYLEGILFLLFQSHPDLSLVFGSLFALHVFSFFINLIPWVETDGYFIVSDLFSIPNLRKKAFRYTGALIKNIFKKAPLPEITTHEKVVYLIYSVLTPSIVVILMFIPAITLLKNKLSDLPVSVTIVLGLIFLVIFFERIIKNALRWYSKSRISTINLKQN